MVGNYSREDLVSGLRKIGLSAGDVVFVQLSLDALGRAEGCATLEARCEMVLCALREVVGDEGTLLVPTYTFSFCRQEEFDVHSTPTKGGPWSESADFLEYFRNLPGVVRSADPIHSVAGLGPKAEELLSGLPHTVFGERSIHQRLMEVGGKLCMVGVGLNEASFRHHVEELVGVPFRFKKLFTGYVRDGEVRRKEGWVYNVRIMADNGFPDGWRLERRALERGVGRVAQVGAGEVQAASCRDFYRLTAEALAQDPWFTARGPAGDPVEMERARVGGRRYEVRLPEVASPEQMVDALWQLPRDIVSDAYDAALDALATQVPMTIHQYPSGSECWSWIVPEKWTCREAYLETMDGERLFSYADHPLHVVSYSLPFRGEVTRDELFEHLHVEPRIPGAVPFKFKYYERDWGLCCSQETKDRLTAERYRVVIDTDFSYAMLRVGEVVAPGRSDETFVLCAHLCHPGMVNDDLTGVVVAVEVMRELLKRRDLRYTYRLLIVPETIGSIAYLSRNEELVPRMVGGLFLEMLGREHAHALQLTYRGDTHLDFTLTEVMKQHDPESWTGAFRTVIGNDERQFNGPGVRVPMLSLSRVLHPSSGGWPYHGYHSSDDNRASISFSSLEASRDLVLAMIDALESDPIPVNRFKGEAFCSRYGLYIDWQTNPEGSRALFDIMSMIDGTRSVGQIAAACGISVGATRRTIDELCKHSLVEYKV